MTFSSALAFSFSVKPFNISDTKQTDLTMDMSLLQIKIENIAMESTYEDISLKNSKEDEFFEP